MTINNLKIMKTIFLSLFLCFLHGFLFAQAEKITFLDGTTLTGAIEVSLIYEDSILFSEKGHKGITKYAISSIASLWDDFKFYKVIKPSPLKKEVLIPVLLDGKTSVLKNKKGFFIGYGSDFHHLYDKNYSDKKLNNLSLDKFARQARDLFNGCLSYDNRKWTNLNLTNRDIVETTWAYNKCEYPQDKQVHYLRNQHKLRRGFYIEGILTKIATTSFSDTESFTPNFAIGGQYAFISNSHFNALVGVRLAYRHNNNNNGNSYYELALAEIPLLIEKRLIRTRLNNGIFIKGGGIIGLGFYAERKDWNGNSRYTKILENSILIGYTVSLGYNHRIKKGSLFFDVFYEQNTFNKQLDILSLGIRSGIKI